MAVTGQDGKNVGESRDDKFGPSAMCIYEGCRNMVHTPHYQTPYITPYIVHANHHGIDDSHNTFIGQDIEYFSQAGFDMARVHLKRNAPVAQLYEDAIRNEGAIISATGALINFSGKKTGRSPKDKRIVYEDSSKDDIWWGPVNIKMDEHTFEINRERAIDYLNTRDLVYVFDGYAGWDPKYRIKVRVICARAYHALFMNNMLIRPTDEELKDFGEPDFIIYNAGQFPANRFTTGMTSTTSVEINFKRMEMVILGTEYAGEMKKGVFSVMHYLMPVKFGQLSLHSSANVGTQDGDVTLFFGLSGTGKTTLSADPARQLIGDDEHVWSDSGVFNIEGGCYAKTINLSAEKEPEIFNAIRFGSILENVVFDPANRHPDYDDVTITENTRCGKYGTGKRCPLKYTRRIVDAIHSGELLAAEYENFDVFNLSIPTHIEGVPREILNPSLAWSDRNAFTREVRKLGAMFNKAFLLYLREVDEKVKAAGPQL
ncbi:hypothetical protein M408DRAFT_7061 [Serendipita vermifera MAFF 305830]|uniref:Phosphoenolpyruvate carboxykinase (ATP) n=1 Tax=Serendipita vermifera MAFF 305830 TaxID=933852 RepID=A0A0C3BIA8_SERVB|nr:hypothetical protein M408DRAFT_7061 [Serendipita vermifera MAFF 305830]